MTVCGFLPRALRGGKPSCRAVVATARSFHASTSLAAIRSFPLADIGEGTTECQIVQWFVKPGARVEAFTAICEVQSDKATSEITSPYDGIIKKLHWEVDEMAVVGKPLIDIDVEEDELALKEQGTSSGPAFDGGKGETQKGETSSGEESQESETQQPQRSSQRTLATPAVRHLSKELKIDLAEVYGTGRDGRVTKEDLQTHAANASHSEETRAPMPSSPLARPSAEDKAVSLTPIQTAMFKTMTKSLTIPHFLYTTTVDLTALSTLRRRINDRRQAVQGERINALAFIIKALSQSLTRFPLLNASLDTPSSSPATPSLTYRANHNFGLAVDTPSGLLVPVIRDVASLSVAELGSRIRHLAARAAQGQLSSQELKGATFTVSNVGAIGSGGGVVAPVIVAPQVAIVGVGRSRVVPGFDGRGNVVPREEVVLSFSADHRVVDGAYAARAAEEVKRLLEGVEEWGLDLR